MNSGYCECTVGLNGSACKHQYMLWLNKKASGCNFIPIFSKNERKRFAEVAIAKSMPMNYYEGLHDQVMMNPSSKIVDFPEVAVETTPSQVERVTDTFDNIDFDSELMRRRSKPVDLVTEEEAVTALTDAFQCLRMRIDEHDQNYLRGIMTFSHRVTHMARSRLSSNLHSFGSTQFSSLRETANLVVKRAKRGKIHVQPEAVKRRKTETGSKNKISKGQQVRSNPFSKSFGKTKRLHQFAENVRRNEPVAKKAGRTMTSKNVKSSRSNNMKEE